MMDIAESLEKAIFDNLKIDGTPEKLMGAKVSFSKSLVKVKKYLNTKEVVWVAKENLTILHGVVVGARYMNVGKIEERHWGEVISTPCILIATSPFQNPTHVSLNGIVSIKLRKLNEQEN